MVVPGANDANETEPGDVDDARGKLCGGDQVFEEESRTPGLFAQQHSNKLCHLRVSVGLATLSWSQNNFFDLRRLKGSVG